jgi:hypothetical protein
LLLLVSAIAVALWWWLRPYAVDRTEDHDPFTGTHTTSTYRLRRGLLGGEVAHGIQSRQMANGQSLRWKQWSGLPDPEGPFAYAHEYFLIDGRLASKKEWNDELRGPDFDQLIDLIVIWPTPQQIAGLACAQDAVELVEPCEQ